MSFKVHLIQENIMHDPRIYNSLITASRAFDNSIEITNTAHFHSDEPLKDLILKLHESADAIICDVSSSSTELVLEIGFALNSSKPIVFIASSALSVPSFLSQQAYLLYDQDSFDKFETRLLNWLNLVYEAKKSGSSLDITEATKARPRDRDQIFISYSHADIEFLTRLAVHLKPLEIEGKVQVWSDEKIAAGQFWKAEIAKALESCHVAILLISADFLASPFIISNELPELLDMAKVAGTRLLPVIVKPCRFRRDSRLREIQAANDPKTPLSGMSEHEREQVYDKIAETIEEGRSRDLT
jgi:hypothetical protein